MIRSTDAMRFVALGLEDVLKSLGFRGKTLVFVRDTGEVYQLIELQKSSSSNASYLKITLNVGLHAKALMRPDEKAPRSTADCQAQFRLSQIMPGPFEDRWWSITDQHEAETALEEMRTRLLGVALPTLDTVKRGVDLLREWDNGGNRNLAPGIEFNRLRFVSSLRNHLSKPDSSSGS